MVLAAYDPARYTFYSHGALRHGHDRYAGATCPKGSMGEVYTQVCSFVQAVGEALKA